MILSIHSSTTLFPFTTWRFHIFTFSFSSSVTRFPFITTHDITPSWQTHIHIHTIRTRGRYLKKRRKKREKKKKKKNNNNNYKKIKEKNKSWRKRSDPLHNLIFIVILFVNIYSTALPRHPHIDQTEAHLHAPTHTQPTPRQLSHIPTHVTYHVQDQARGRGLSL